MAVTAQGTGTQTAVIGTEHNLANVNAAASFTLHVDLVNMATGDVLALRVYQMVLTGGTSRVAYRQDFAGAQVDASGQGIISISVPISNELSDATALQFTLQQTAGTGRSYPWKILKYA